MRSMFLGALLNIFLNIYLPIYGILGAAYATTITYIFKLCFLTIKNKKDFEH